MTQRKAYCMIREQPVYRRDCFVRGLAAAGFGVMPYHVAPQGAPGDVLVIWNRYGTYHDIAKSFEKAGGQVLVAENGYVGNDRSARTRYAIAIGGHNGIGTWSIGDGKRWDDLGIKLAPWRREGDHVLVCPNRSFGMPGFLMPPTWAEAVEQRLRCITKRPIRVRPHPGNDPARRPLASDLKGAWAVVIWSSSAGIEALIAGIPVFSQAPAWVMSAASSGSNIKDIESPVLPDRLFALRRMAWAQWHIEEIERGTPFQYLCDRSSSFTDRV